MRSDYRRSVAYRKDSSVQGQVTPNMIGTVAPTSSGPSFRLVKIVLLAGSALLAFLVLLEAIRISPVHGENLTAESSTILITRGWAQGQHLYSDFRKPPFFITPFPPGLYAILALAFKAGVTRITQLMLLGRLLSLFSLLATACIAYVWSRSNRLPRSLSFIAPLFFLSFPAVLPWAATVRQDFPALFFAALAGFTASRSSNTRSVLVAALAAVAAFLIKHSSVAIPSAIVIWLLFRKRTKDAVFFSALWFAAVGAVFALFQKWSSGMMMLNISGSKIYGRLGLRNVHDAVMTVFFDRGHQAVILTLSLAIVGLAVTFRDWRTHRSLLACYFVSG